MQIIGRGDASGMVSDAWIPGRGKDLCAIVLCELPNQSVLASAAADYKYSQWFASNLIE
jgi:hypothetical protein